MRDLTSAYRIAVLAVLSVLPVFCGDSALSILTLILMAAYFGQAWNIMMGYVGQLSLGHALFVGLGAYSLAVAVGTFGLSPWIGILIGAAISSIAGGFIAWVGFRYAMRGVYFTLLTIACAELARIAFSNWAFVGGSGGYFLRASTADHVLRSLRGDATFFYYAFMVLCSLALVICTLLSRSRVGYLWRAIREDEDAAQAIGVRPLRLKMLACVISAAMTSVGGAFYALLNGSLLPETVMSIHFSIQILIAPVIGGLGTLVGPILGSLFVVPVNELSNHIAQQTAIAGLNIFVYGIMIVTVACFLPAGVWPTLSERVGRWVRLTKKEGAR